MVGDVYSGEATLTVLDERAAQLRPLPDYARRLFPEAFEDLEASLLPMLEATDRSRFDVTAFYSRRKAGLGSAVEKELVALDQAAYEAAVAVGGLVVYFRGNVVEVPATNNILPDDAFSFVPNCMSGCIWATRAKALEGASARAHANAIKGIRSWFDHSGIVKYGLTTGVSHTPSGICIEKYASRQLF